MTQLQNRVAVRKRPLGPALHRLRTATRSSRRGGGGAGPSAAPFPSTRMEDQS